MSRLSIKLTLADDFQIGPGKIRLLELIDELGSISAAGRAMNMSYRRAWLLIDELNRGLGMKVVETQMGGRTGGGAVLTDTGHALITGYRSIQADAERLAVDRLGRLLGAALTQPR